MPTPLRFSTLAALTLCCLAAPLLPARAAAQPSIALEPCPRDVISIVGAECGKLEVFENRAAGQGRTIALNIAVLPALGRKPQPDPLFVLAGGPGQAATEMAGLIERSMRRIRDQRDIVLVDQRGTGESNPLDCEQVDPDSTLYLPTADQFEPLKTCLEGFDADPRFYTTPVAMDDLDQVRQALGYEHINLWGGSYGTRAALVYLRRHPEHVRTVIVDGLAPPAIRLPLHLGADGSRAMDLLLDDCEADPGCNASFPGLRKKLTDLFERLDQEPLPARIQHPRSGKYMELPITRDGVAFLLRYALYSAELSALLPLIIERAGEGDFGPLAALADPLWTDLDKAMSVGMFFSVICSEDLPFIGPDERRQLQTEPFLGTAALDLYSQVCDFWPRGVLPAGYHDPVVSDKPVLVLSGELDPVTPPRWGEEVVQHLENGRHLVVPGVAHGTLLYGCSGRIMAAFIDQGSTRDLDIDCLQQLRRPPFFNSYTGPRPGEAP